jgi:hypothetical protein
VLYYTLDTKGAGNDFQTIKYSEPKDPKGY